MRVHVHTHHTHKAKAYAVIILHHSLTRIPLLIIKSILGGRFYFVPMLTMAALKHQVCYYTHHHQLRHRGAKI